MTGKQEPCMAGGFSKRADQKILQPGQNVISSCNSPVLNAVQFFYRNIRAHVVQSGENKREKTVERNRITTGEPESSKPAFSS